MSYYYNYYIGYMHEGKIYPFGPYNSKGKLRDVISRSRSFASELHSYFYPIKEEMISDELRKQFEYKDWNGNPTVDVKWLPIDELPHESYIKSGYFLIEDVKAYQKTESSEDLFYDKLSPEVYAAMLQKECMGIKPAPQKDSEGYDITPHAASEYMFFAYLDYYCEEYEASLIRDVANMLNEYGDLEKDDKLVILETEG